MKYLIFAAVAIAAPSAAYAQNATCSALTKSYENTSKVLALSESDGIGDTSAIRETNRDLDKEYQLRLAEIDLGLMRDNKCVMPKQAPSPLPYIIQALDCARKRGTGSTGDIPECRIADWVAKS